MSETSPPSPSVASADAPPSKHGDAPLPLVKALSQEFVALSLDDNGASSPRLTETDPSADTHEDDDEEDEEETRANVRELKLAVEDGVHHLTGSDHLNSAARSNTPRPDNAASASSVQTADVDAPSALAMESSTSPIVSSSSGSCVVAEQEPSQFAESEVQPISASTAWEPETLSADAEQYVDEYGAQFATPPQLPRLWSTEDPEAPEFPEQYDVMRTDIFQSFDGKSHRTVEVHCASTCFRVYQHVHHVNLVPAGDIEASDDEHDDDISNLSDAETSLDVVPALSLGPAAAATSAAAADEWLSSEPPSQLSEWHVDMTISCTSDSPRETPLSPSSAVSLASAFSSSSASSVSSSADSIPPTHSSLQPSPILQALSSPHASPILQPLSSPQASPILLPVHSSSSPRQQAQQLVPVEESCAYMYICTSLQQAMDCFLEMVSRALAANMQHAFPTCEVQLGSEAFHSPRSEGLLFLQELRRHAAACRQTAAEHGGWLAVATSEQLELEAQNLCSCIENYINKTHLAGVLVTQLQSFEVVNLVLELGLQLPLTPSNPWTFVVPRLVDLALHQFVNMESYRMYPILHVLTGVESDAPLRRLLSYTAEALRTNFASAQRYPVVYCCQLLHVISIFPLPCVSTFFRTKLVLCEAQPERSVLELCIDILLHPDVGAPVRCNARQILSGLIRPAFPQLGDQSGYGEERRPLVEFMMMDTELGLFARLFASSPADDELAAAIENVRRSVCGSREDLFALLADLGADLMTYAVDLECEISSEQQEQYTTWLKKLESRFLDPPEPEDEDDDEEDLPEMMQRASSLDDMNQARREMRRQQKQRAMENVIAQTSSASTADDEDDFDVLDSDMSMIMEDDEDEDEEEDRDEEDQRQVLAAGEAVVEEGQQ